jgi:hypothetical protein
MTKEKKETQISRTPQSCDSISTNTNNPRLSRMPDGIQNTQRLMNSMGALKEFEGDDQRVHHQVIKHFRMENLNISIVRS